jgi:hypothetical protein
MKGDEKNALIERRIARAMDTIEEVSFLIKNKKFLLSCFPFRKTSSWSIDQL